MKKLEEKESAGEKGIIGVDSFPTLFLLIHIIDRMATRKTSPDREETVSELKASRESKSE